MAKELNSSAETRVRVAKGAEKVYSKKEGESDVRNVDGVHEHWEKKGSFSIDYMTDAIMLGCNATGGLVIESSNDVNNNLNVTGYGTNQRKIVITSKEKTVDSYASLPDGRNVVGTCDGNIDFYDHDWKHIARVNAYGTSLLSSGYRWIKVTVDTDGMILATNGGGSTVLVVDPRNRQIVKHFRVIDKEAKPIYGMAALSKGHLAIRTKCAQGEDIAVVDRSGVVKATSHLHKSVGFGRFAVDWTRDVMYVMLMDVKSNHCTIEAISVPSLIAGNMSTTSVIKYMYTGVELPYEFVSLPSFVIPDPGKIFILDCTQVHIFQRV